MKKNDLGAFLLLLVLAACSDKTTPEPAAGTTGSGGSSEDGSGGTGGEDRAASSGGSASGGTASGGSGGSGGAGGTGGSTSASDGSATSASAGAAGAAGESGSDGSSLPGCQPSFCDAYQNETACNDAVPEPYSFCFWHRVVFVPDGDVACAEVRVEERCMAVNAFSPGSCPGLFCEGMAQGAGAMFRTAEGTFVTQVPFCSLPQCFEHCDLGYDLETDEPYTENPACLCACE